MNFHKMYKINLIKKDSNYKRTILAFHLKLSSFDVKQKGEYAKRGI